MMQSTPITFSQLMGSRQRALTLLSRACPDRTEATRKGWIARKSIARDEWGRVFNAIKADEGHEALKDLTFAQFYMIMEPLAVPLDGIEHFQMKEVA